MTDGERQQIDDYVAEYEAAQKDNAYTGLLAGKNVIMVQLEAIDTWMLQEAYMPNLAKLKSEGWCLPTITPRPTSPPAPSTPSL